MIYLGRSCSLWRVQRTPLTTRAPYEGPKDFGGDSGGVTPVPIPNTVVKPTSADGTWDESPRESRSPPDFATATGPKGPVARFKYNNY